MAGTRVIRTTTASTRIPTARPRAIGLSVRSSAVTKLANTANMISAAAVTTRDACRAPEITEAPCRPVWTYSSRMRDTRKTS
ncbi:hypothetical protein BC342_05035 [Streptomyces olivaceus]|nr:hypothetical protein BC342_05035 [Streptomyces olivaceus]